jgi:hypothetical protein
MPETITVTKFYSNREIAEILGCTPEYIRKLKSTKKDELAGLWRNDGGGDETVWSEDGLNKLAELISTDKAKEFRAGALARRTEQAIAVDRAELNYPNPEQNSTRTGHEVNSYEIKSPVGEGGRYAGLTKRIGGAIADQMIDNGAIEEIDNAVIDGLLRGLSIGDINVKDLLSK